MDVVKEKPAKKKEIDPELSRQLFNAFEKEEKYEYVRSIAGNHFLDYDDYGEPCGWGVSLVLFYELHTDVSEDYPIQRGIYDENHIVQNSIAAIGLDSEKLWHAIRFIRFISESKFVDANPLLPPLGPQVDQLLDLMGGGGTTIRIEHPEKKTVVLSKELRDYVMALIEKDYFARKGDPLFTGRLH